MKALFSSAIFGLVPAPSMAPCDTLLDSPGGRPMSEIQANGAGVKGNVNYEASQRECGAGGAVDSPLSTKALICALVVLTALGGIAGYAAEIDYSIRHMAKETRAIVVDTENQFWQGQAPGPIDPHNDDSSTVPGGERHVLTPVTRGMRPTTKPHAQTKDLQLASAGASATTVGKIIPNKPTTTPQDIVIDVIVAYTKKSASGYADIKRELIDLAIEETNKSFRLSNLGHIAVRLVHAYQTDYAEEGAHFDHIWRFADKGDGYMEEIHGLRNLHRADVAVLVMDDPKGCGLATRVHADADEAFAVVHHECAAANYTLAHEIGHLIGARHELSYAKGTQWRDIMGSMESCGGCPRMPVWSGPTVLVNGEPAGTPELNNARVIAEQAARVAAFR